MVSLRIEKRYDNLQFQHKLSNHYILKTKVPHFNFTMVMKEKRTPITSCPSRTVLEATATTQSVLTSCLHSFEVHLDSLKPVVRCRKSPHLNSHLFLLTCDRSTSGRWQKQKEEVTLETSTSSFQVAQTPSSTISGPSIINSNLSLTLSQFSIMKVYSIMNLSHVSGETTIEWRKKWRTKITKHLLLSISAVVSTITLSPSRNS